MGPDLAGEEAALIGRREPYARVTVVWSQRPASARAGDVALVTLDGRLRGWVGGSCSEPVIGREALAALAEGRPRLVHLAPPCEVSEARDGVVIAPVACASGGSLEVFVEPFLPHPHLVVVGRSPMVRALATMASATGFDVAVVERDDIDPAGFEGATLVQDLDLGKAGAGPDSFVVVATMGRYDEDALEAAMDAGAQYVALVASSRRAAAVRSTLRDNGMAEADLGRLRSPAGLDLGPIRHQEIAVAVLAEIVAEKARRPPAAPHSVAPVADATDPVCGMAVEVSDEAYLHRHDGHTYWFCGRACQRRFVAHPDTYLGG
jgi:xanthine dehydrogenase accessory factor